jgi:hypothetical protein
VFFPCASQAKTDDDQSRIILLNDSAAALEGSEPGLSKSLSQFADEKEKEWEAKQTNKDQLPAPVTDKELFLLRDRIDLLNKAAHALKPDYPLISKSLYKMAKDLNRTIENEQ